MRVHLIAIGGSVMHNLALALQQRGYQVSGSDDEIYDPARSRLRSAGLLPSKDGWDASRISPDLDAVILGMHARKQNPELLRAQSLGLPIYSFPAFFYENAREKTRIVVAGSHGKTSTTSMIMHVLQEAGMDFDYLVGAQLEGFDTMVRLSDAPLAVIEGDEYLSSALDDRPKFLHYQPQIAVVTGIAWDHINVFPTFETYVDQFDQFFQSLPEAANVFWYAGDEILQQLTGRHTHLKAIPYHAIPHQVERGQTRLTLPGEPSLPISLFGQHNMENLQAARLVCRELGITDATFAKSIQTFKGAARRLQKISETEEQRIFLDYAHAPSKVAATVRAVKEQYPDRPLVACLELHTFSSLNADFHPHYRHTLKAADEAVVFFSAHTLQMKRMPAIDPEQLALHFDHPNLQVFSQKEALDLWWKNLSGRAVNILLMSSGRFDGWIDTL